MSAALGGAPTAGERAYLALLDRRLAALAGPGPLPDVSAVERECARRFLAPREGAWHDGDENLVRGLVEAWSGSPDTSAGRAARLLDSAGALARMNAPPTTLWFFLWEMESVLASLEGRAQR